MFYNIKLSILFCVNNLVTVGEKGQIVIPSEARKIFDIKPGDRLLMLGDEEQGIAIVKCGGTNDFIDENSGKEIR